MRQKTIELLGDYAIDQRSNSGKLNERRIKILIDFMEKNKTDKIEIVKNNVSTCGPSRRNRKDCVKLGGRHGYYHLWAVYIKEEDKNMKKIKKMNQEDAVLAWLKEGKELNKTIAYDELGVANLNTKIFRLRDEGFPIEKEPELRACKKTGRKMAHYFLEKGRF